MTDIPVSNALPGHVFTVFRMKEKWGWGWSKRFNHTSGAMGTATIMLCHAAMGDTFESNELQL